MGNDALLVAVLTSGGVFVALAVWVVTYVDNRLRQINKAIDQINEAKKFCWVQATKANRGKRFNGFPGSDKK